PVSPSSPGNPLLLNSSMQPELTTGQTYSGPICFQDSIDKELFDPLPDMMVKVQSSFMVSLGVADRAEYHVKAHPEGYSGTQGRKSNLLAPNGPLGPCKAQLRSSGVFGHLGGRLVMPNTGVSLLVSHGAISEDTSWEMYMLINQGQSSAPSEERCEILLGPEVTYGPPGLSLSSPVAMTIAHCAEVSAENWNIQLKRQTKDNKWEEVMSVEDESTACYCLLDSQSCHLLLDEPGSYALVGEPLNEHAGKRLKVAVFGSLEASTTNYSLRVYCVDDTPHAFQDAAMDFAVIGGMKNGQLTIIFQTDDHQLLGLGFGTHPQPVDFLVVGHLARDSGILPKFNRGESAMSYSDSTPGLVGSVGSARLDGMAHAAVGSRKGVVSAETSRGGLLLEEPKTLLFKGNTYSLQVSIQDLPQFLWSIKPFTTCQEFSFCQVWSSNQQPLHCAFSLERFTTATTQLSCKISVRQVKGHEQILQVYTTVAEREKETLPFFMQADCTVTSQTGAKAFKIPLSIRQRICATFDTANSKGKDWQLLAQKLHIQRNLSYFAKQRSPSGVILSLWEARHQADGDLDSLASALEEISKIHSKSLTQSPSETEPDFNQ
ncbi:hypothetical protein NFI96_026595, partial [Prochilodus magdalenae]